MNDATLAFVAPLILVALLGVVGAGIRVAVDAYHRHQLGVIAPEAPELYRPPDWTERTLVVLAFALVAYDFVAISRGFLITPTSLHYQAVRELTRLCLVGIVAHGLLFAAVCWAVAAMALLRVRRTKHSAPGFHLDARGYRFRRLIVRLVAAAALLVGWGFAVYLNWLAAGLLPTVAPQAVP